MILSGQLKTPIIGKCYLFIGSTGLPTIIEKDSVASVEERKVLVIYLQSGGIRNIHHPTVAMGNEEFKTQRLKNGCFNKWKNFPSLSHLILPLKLPLKRMIVSRNKYLKSLNKELECFGEISHSSKLFSFSSLHQSKVS